MLLTPRHRYQSHLSSSTLHRMFCHHPSIPSHNRSCEVKQQTMIAGHQVHLMICNDGSVAARFEKHRKSQVKVSIF